MNADKEGNSRNFLSCLVVWRRRKVALLVFSESSSLFIVAGRLTEMEEERKDRDEGQKGPPEKISPIYSSLEARTEEWGDKAWCSMKKEEASVMNKGTRAHTHP